MWKKFAASVGENALNGAATGVGQALGDEIRPLVENVRTITDDVKELTGRLERIEANQGELRCMLTEVLNRIKDPVVFTETAAQKRRRKGRVK